MLTEAKFECSASVCHSANEEFLRVCIRIALICVVCEKKYAGLFVRMTTAHGLYSAIESESWK